MARVDGDTLLHMLVEALTALPHDAQRTSLYTAGINTVTRALEDRIQTVREGRKLEGRVPHLLFVCVADMDPPTLVAHLPMLTANYNAVVSQKPVSSLEPSLRDPDSVDPRMSWTPSTSAEKTRPVILVPLPQGSELVLSTALGVRRLSALLLFSSADEPSWRHLERHICQTLGMHTVLWGFRLPWLDHAAALQPICVKHVASSAPHVAQGKRAKKASS